MTDLLVQVGNTWIQMSQVAMISPMGPSEVQIRMVGGEKVFLRYSPDAVSAAINKAASATLSPAPKGNNDE